MEDVCKCALCDSLDRALVIATTLRKCREYVVSRKRPDECLRNQIDNAGTLAMDFVEGLMRMKYGEATSDEAPGESARFSAGLEGSEEEPEPAAS